MKKIKIIFRFMYKGFEILLRIVFPQLYIIYTNKKVDLKIKKMNENAEYQFTYMRGYKKITIEQNKEFLKNTMEVKRILEDKAKSVLFAVTLSVSLITGFSNSLKFGNNGISTLEFLILLLSIFVMFYLISAGILSLYSLGSVNTFSNYYAEDLALDDCGLKEIIAFSAEYNSKVNIKRNNIMNASYKCIINALLLLFLTFIIQISIPGENIDSYLNQIIKIEDELNYLENQFNSELSSSYNELLKLRNQVKIIKSEIDKNYKLNEKYITNEINKIELELDKVNELLINYSNSK